MDDSQLRNFLQKTEGNEESLYNDTKGNPTVGAGLNLNSPVAQRYMASQNLKPMDMMAKEHQDRLADIAMEDTHKNFDTMKSNHFPTKEFNPAQETALKSMMYNAGPDIIGPNMKQMLNQNDDMGVIKEMMLRSNQSQDPGILKRRLMEAEMYGGPVDFNLAAKSMSSDERKELQKTINKMQNDNELKRVLDQYKFLNEDYQEPYEPVKFNKLMRQGLVRPKANNNG